MITFVYQNQTGVYDPQSRLVTWSNQEIKISDIAHDMRVIIENASC